MRIGIVVGYFPKISETFILNQITGLIDRKQSVQIIAKQRPDENIQHHKIEEYQLQNITNYYAVSSTKTHKILALLIQIPKIAIGNPKSFKKILWEMPRNPREISCVLRTDPFLKNDFDIIHAHFGSVGQLTANLKKFGVISDPLIISFHGSGIRAGKMEKNNFYENVFRESNKLLANSHATKKSLLDMGADEESVKVHPVGINPARFPYTPPKIAPNKKIILLSVGRLVKEKGHKDGIRAVSQIINSSINLDVRYRIVGDGPKRSQLEKVISSLGMTQKIKLLGSKSREGVIAEMQKADIYVHPSYSEGLGMVLLEAQATGLPVVATDVGGIPEAVVPNCSADLVQPGDIFQLVSSIKSLLNDQDRWKNMAKCGRNHVEENFNVNQLNTELLNTYNQVLTSSG